MISTRLKGVIFCGVALGALAQVGTAQAQNATTEQSVADAGQIEEIIVTANRREQSLQSVPIAISAVTAEAALQRGITGVASLQATVPSLIVSRQANQAQPYLRGLGASSGSANAEPSVALYVDGVYFPSANANFFDFNNVERIEVLKGPQGTLFGRNATGGVIQIITKDPGDTFEGNINVGYANYQTFSGQAYLSAPITENLGANIAVLVKDQGKGWGRNIFTGQEVRAAKDLGFRGKIVWSDDATKIRLAGDYSHNRGPGINGQVPPGSTGLDFPLVVATGRGTPYPGRYNVNDNWEQQSNIKTRGVSLTAEHDFGNVILESISAYRKTTGFWTFDQDLSPWPGVNARIEQRARMYSQEVHLLSEKSSKLQWLLGAYYYNYKAGNAPQAVSGFLLDPTFPGCVFANSCNVNAGVDLYNNTKSTSFSVFGQATYPLGDLTNLTVGARYTWEKVVFNGVTTVHGTLIPVPGIGGPGTFATKDSAPTFRLAIDHKITPTVMLYASYNKGRKSGGYDLGDFVVPNVQFGYFNAEKVDAFEAGVKSDLFDRHLRLNVGGFYYDFKNMQFQKVESGAGRIFNAPNGAQIYGLEADAEARVDSNLTLNASAGYLHTRIRDFPGAPNTCLNRASGLNDGGGFFCNGPNGLPDPANLIPYNAKGNRTPNSPELSVNLGALYNIPTSVGTFSLSGNASYTSKLYFEIDNRTFNPSQWLFNASVGWKDEGERYSVRVWGRNLSNKYYYTQYTGQANASDNGSPAAPREYGITVGYTF